MIKQENNVVGLKRMKKVKLRKNMKEIWKEHIIVAVPSSRMNVMTVQIENQQVISWAGINFDMLC